MIGYFTDLAIVGLLIIAITALMGGILKGLGDKVFKRKDATESFDYSARMQTGWKSVGGKK